MIDGSATREDESDLAARTSLTRIMPFSLCLPKFHDILNLCFDIKEPSISYNRIIA